MADSDFDPILRTTVIQAFARTMVDDSRDKAGSVARSVTGPHTPNAPDASSLPDIGDVIGNLYRLMRLLGKGMFGRVFVAERVDVPEHRVALKLVPRSVYQGRNVERELVMLATVGHPNVVQMKDHGTTSEYVWLTMPVYQGQTLAERLEKKPLTLKEAHDIFLAVARGLEALHAVGLRHQDVKPDNIFLAQFAGRVHPILLDLGVAAEREAPFVAGTALYASPEQIAALNGYPGAIPLSEKMDTYCLATTLLMSLVGPKRFPGETAKSRAEIAEAQDLRAEQPIPSDCLIDIDPGPRDMIAAAFRKWLALEPEERPTMSELADQLDVLLEPEREEARKEERKRARQRRNYGRLRFVAMLLFLGAIASAAVVFWKRQTIALASQLDQARSKSAESFDKLDTCNSSYRIAQMNVNGCKADREHDQQEFQRALANMTKTGDAAENDRAKQLQSFATKLKICEEQKTTCNDESLKAAAEAQKDHATLVSQRDEAKAAAEARANEMAALENAKNDCSLERSQCVAERDACKAQARISGVLGGHTPPVPASGAPLAPPATGDPQVGLKTPPLPPPPPPPQNPAPVENPY